MGWLLHGRLKGKITVLSLAQEMNQRMNKECHYH